jgi:hypothetical protein
MAFSNKIGQVQGYSYFLWFVPAVKYLPRYIPEQEPNCASPLYSGTKPRPILLFSSEIAKPTPVSRPKTSFS